MTRKSVSVAIVEPVGGHGGMDYYDFGLCAGLLKTGCKVSLYTCDQTKPPAIPGLSFYPIYRGIYEKISPVRGALRFLLASVKVMIRTVISGEKICHFHVFHGGATEIFGILLARAFLRRVVITVHDVESFGADDKSKSTVGWVYGLASQMIVHNQSCRALAIEKLGISAGKIRIIPMGNFLHVIGDIPDKQQAKRDLGLNESATIILFFGHIKEVKGLDLLLRAMPKVVAAVPNVLLLIAGRTWRTEFSRYEAMMDELGIQNDCVAHIRHISDDEVPLYYGASDVVALPYRRIYQSAVLLMAMSYGKAVLASDLPAMIDLIRDGENGFLFRQESHEDLAQKLIAVLRDNETRERVAARGFDYVRQHFDWSQIGAATAKIYEDALV
jgi:D-inositol-3-phosphate glycosyltransferase